MKKKYSVVVAIFITALLFVGTCWALVPDGIVLVDADANSDEVRLNIVQSDLYPLLLGHSTLGYMNGGNFQAFDYIAPYTLAEFKGDGGTVVDFAIKDAWGGVHSLSEGAGTVTFLGTAITNPPIVPENPSWVNKWYNSFVISWHCFLSYFTTTVEVGVVDSGQGYSGVAAVPIPTSVWIFGSGLVALVGIRRKFKT